MADQAHLQTPIGFNDGSLDAFGRQRVSDPQTIFDNTFQYDKSPISYEEINSGTGKVTHVPQMSSVVLDTGGTASGAEAVLQQRQYNHYQPGKSQLIIMTVIFPEKQTNLRTRAGYFDANGGLYFEQDSIGLKLVRRNYVDGEVTEEIIRQGDWNVDNIDGSGKAKNPSGMVLDPTKHNIYWIDLEWLGAGTVRYGVYYQGRPVVIHEIYNENNRETTYMPTGSLPLRFENSNTGATESSSQFLVTCQTVVSEGGFEKERGNIFSVNNGTTAIGATTRRALLSIRPKPTFNSITPRSIIELVEANVMVATNNALIELVYSPTFTGTPTWTSANSNSVVEYSVHGDAGAGALSGGTVIQSGYGVAGQAKLANIASSDIISKLPIVRDHNGDNPIAVSIVATAQTGTSSILSAITWKEIR